MIRTLPSSLMFGAWAAAVAVAYVPTLPSNAIVGRWALVGVGAALLLMMQLAQLRPVCPTPAHRMLGLLLAWMLAGWWWSASGWDTAGEMVQWVALFAAFCVAAEEPDLTNFWRGMAGGVSVSALFSLAQYYGVDEWTVHFRNGSTLTVSSLWTLHLPTGLFLSKNMIADVATLTLVGAAASRMWWGVPGPLLSLYLVGSSASVLALVLAAVTWAWFSLPRYRWFIGLLAAWGMTALGTLAWQGRVGTLHERFEIWALIPPHLGFLGNGLGTFAAYAPNLEYAHNEFLQYAFELGYLGAALIVATFTYAWVVGDTRARAVLAALAALCLLWFPLHAPAAAMVAVVVAGHAAGQHERRWFRGPQGREDGGYCLSHLTHGPGGAVPASGPAVGRLHVGRPGRHHLLAALGGGAGLPAGPEAALGPGKLRGAI